MRKFFKKKLYWIVTKYRELFNYPKLSLAKVDYDDYWRDKRGGKLGILNSFQRARAEWIVANINEDSTVIDLGCGDGAVLLYMLNKKKFKAIGVDTSNFALNHLKKHNVETLNIELDKPEALSMIPDSDHILILEVLEHLQNPEEFLNLVVNKAKKSVFFSFPNTGYIKYRLRLLFGKFPVQWRLHPGEHLRFWTYQDLQWWLGELGYTEKATIHVYEGVPVLNKIFKSLLGAAFIVELKV